ncbi:putative MFS allantoate transporter [Aureobasidium pullulans]|nr:putative MFS allantoate transporter [Aureobasidium pullulans]
MHQASPQIKTTRHSMEKAELGLEPTTTPAIGGQVLLDVTFTADEERKVVRKIDCIILPMMCFVFFCQYLDKQSLSYASVAGLITDLKMDASQYSWCSSIFYIGQLVSEYPFIYLMSRLRLTKLVGFTIIVWGGICMCLAAPKDFAGFAAVRFLLGFSEGAVSPAFVSITSYWYKKEEHAMRTALWISMNAIAQVVGSLLMFGIAESKHLDLAPWRVMFIVCGAMTAAIGVIFFFAMPSGPSDAWFLNQREREVLMARMARSHEGGDHKDFSMTQLKEALLDYKVFLIFCFGLLVTMQSPVLTFASLIIKGLGYSRHQTLLYTAPSGAVQLVLIWLGVLMYSWFPRNRCAIAIILCIPPLIGCFVLLKLPASAGWGVVVSSWLASCITAPWSMLLSLSASNIKGNTKRSVANAVFFIGYCAGCIASPQLWKHSPRYFSGVVTAIVTWFLLIITTGAWWALCRRENQKRDAEGVEPETTQMEDSFAGLDLTDKQDRAFRYSW